MVNSVRPLTTRLPPKVLFALCRVGSPIVFLLFAVPYRLLRSVPGLKALAKGLPFRHAGALFGLVGDLYGRFSAPVEYRYSRGDAAKLMTQAGLAVTRVAYERGWMVLGRRTES
jgi:hypothetical protein